MALKYSLMLRKNRETGEVRVYGIVVPESNTSVDIITSELTARSTLTRPDVLATLAGIAEKAITELAEARTVRLGDLGSLYVTLRSKGAKNVDEFNSTLIEGVNIRFRPSSFLRKQLASVLTYERSVSKKLQAAAVQASIAEIQTAINGATNNADDDSSDSSGNNGGDSGNSQG